MARDFDDATPDYLQTDSPGITSEPFSMACWAQAHDTSIVHSLMFFGDNSGGNNWHSLSVNTGGNVQAVSRQGSGATGAAATSGTISTSTWFHAAGVWTDDSDRKAYLDGSEGTDTTTIVVNGENRIACGMLRDSSPSNAHDGLVAEAAVWDVALTPGEIAILAKGYSPLFVRPQGLVHYWPLIGRFDPEVDLVGGASLTVATAIQAAHPRVFMPMNPIVGVPAAIVAGGRIMGSLAGAGGLAGSGGIAGRGGGLAG